MSRLSLAVLFAVPLATGAAGAFAQPVARPVVVELFTSQSCSSCPPANALLVELAHSGPGVLPLAFHVDYWDYLNWRDKFSSPAATARQRHYAASLGSEVYTPQIVVQGRTQVVGSNRAAVTSAIEAARSGAGGPAMRLSASGERVTVHVDPGFGIGTVLLVGFDPAHTTTVGGGENTGRTLQEANIVRGMTQLGAWHGAAADLTGDRPHGERLAALLQGPDGEILSAQAFP